MLIVTTSPSARPTRAIASPFLVFCAQAHITAVMAATGVEQTPVNGEKAPASAPRKFKASDLPLPSATRAAIESLAHSFKKEGAYDSIRKQVWDKFEASVCLPRTHAYFCANRTFRITRLKLPSQYSKWPNKKSNGIHSSFSHSTGERQQPLSMVLWRDLEFIRKRKMSLAS